MARKRPTASDVSPVPEDLNAPQPVRDGLAGADGLSHAQARALLRCTPLTSAEFKSQRQLRAVYGGPKHVEIPLRLGTPGDEARGRPGFGIDRLREEVKRVDQ